MDIKLVTEQYVIYSPDLLGFGRSSRPKFRGKTGKDARVWWVDSMEEWRKNLHLENFVLVGHSLGGWISLAYTLQYPQYVSKLVVSDSPGISKIEPTELSDWKSMLFNLYWNLPPQRIVRIAGFLGPRIIRKFKGHLVDWYPYDDDKIVLDYLYHLTAGSGSGEFATTKLMTTRGWLYNIQDELSSIKASSLVVCGRDDYLLFESEELYSLLKCPKDISVINGAGHSPHMSESRAWNAAVKKFLIESHEIDSNRIL